jgi:hypothetical protein
MLAKEPLRRPQSPRELLDELVPLEINALGKPNIAAATLPAAAQQGIAGLTRSPDCAASRFAGTD